MIGSTNKSTFLWKYIKNSACMLTEFFIKLVSSIFVIIYLARYLGPEKFGTLSYILTLVAIFTTIASLGIRSILIRELVKHPENTKTHIETTFWILLASSTIMFFLLFISVYLFEGNPNIQLYTWIISIGMIFQSLLVIDYNFQAQSLAKYSSIAKILAFSLTSIIKLYLIFSQAELLMFVISYSIDPVIIGGFLIGAHLIKKQPYFGRSFEPKLAKTLLNSTWPMLISAVSAMLYMRLDQIMIKTLLNEHQLGLYAASSKLFEGWIIFTYVASISLLPAIIKLKALNEKIYEKNLIKLFRLFIYSGILVFIITLLFSDIIVLYTFGPEFIESRYSLIILMSAAPFISIRALTLRYLTAEHKEKTIAFITIVSLLSNIVLNFLLIPIHGIIGAAISTLISIFVGSYAIFYFDSRLIGIKCICNKAIIPPLNLNQR